MDDELRPYVRIALVGRGAHGMCYAYRKPKDRDGPPKKVIVKRISIEGMTAEEQEALQEEARLLQSLRHPNIVSCYGCRTSGNDPLNARFLYIMMHYAEGGTLEKLIHERQGKYLPEQLIKFYFAQLAQALRYLHSVHIIHRDVKTQNILMNRKRTIVMLGDFGISKQTNNTLSECFTVVGTPNYLSPEVIKSAGYNSKSDLWALGCVLYEMVELKRAFEGEFGSLLQKITEGRIRERTNPTSQNISELIDKLLNVDPEQRLDAETVITHPSVLRTCIDITLDLGRVENEMENLITKSIHPPIPTTGHSLNNTLRATSVPTLTMQTQNGTTLYNRSWQTNTIGQNA
ncbi:hypothetical protein M3Y94_00903900 [Aphelenchoides besseyi]|nr:hypothetical protein M3Y94_00903900 [Aphelenchoides besseyi]KAI6223323.1 Protein kinase domain-containing protein [Aphelenchoides besseyi]